MSAPCAFAENETGDGSPESPDLFRLEGADDAVEHTTVVE